MSYTTIKSVHCSELSNLAYSIWKGNPGLWAANKRNALKLLIELHGRCESEKLDKRCTLFKGHSREDRHFWEYNGTDLSWTDEVEPVT